MDLETKVDGLREVLARVENKLSQIIKKQELISRPESLVRYTKPKCKYDQMLDERRQECIDLIELKNSVSKNWFLKGDKIERQKKL